MAANKRTHPRKPRSRFLTFPEIKGKKVEAVEIDEDVLAITIVFEDKTVLAFDIDPQLVVFPELANTKTGNWRSIKRWPAQYSRISTIKWP